MTIQYINTGTAPNQGNGDTLRTAFTKINNNFAQLSDSGASADLVGSVISDPTLQRGISVTYNTNTEKASFLVNIANQNTLGAVRIGSGITVDQNGLISVTQPPTNKLTSGTSTLSLSPNGALVLDQQGAYNDQEVAGTLFRIDTNQPNYTQLTIHNYNTGTTATSDIIFVRNDGDVETATGVLDIGINSSNYQEEDPYGLHSPGSAYIFTNDADLIIGTQSPNNRLIFHAGGSNSTDSALILDGYAWRFNRSVQVVVPTPGPLNFTVWNTQNNSAAQAVYQAINNAGEYIHFGINSSNPGAVFGNIGPGESFLHNHSTTATLHIGSEGDLAFYSNESDGYSGTATLYMSRADRSSTFSGHVLPASDLAYDLGSLEKQWRSLYVGTSTIFIGGVPISVNTASNTLVVGTPTTGTTTATNLATESFVIDYVNQNGGGGSVDLTVTVPGTTYKGFGARYGRVYANSNSDELTVSKIVIYKEAADTASTISDTSSDDDFEVTGLTNSDVVALFVLYGDTNAEKSLDTLRTFARAAIDTVILEDGVEGSVNTIEAMRSAFYASTSTLVTAAGGLVANFQFYNYNNQYQVIFDTTGQGTGSGFDVNQLSYNFETGLPEVSGWGNGPGYTQGDIIIIPGTSINYQGTPLASPANDVTITVTQVNVSGFINSFTVAGTLPPPPPQWPTDSISDGGSDQYDTGNYINTNLAQEISYAGGEIVEDADAQFGAGSSYVVLYDRSIFGVIATGSSATRIGTSGNSGADGNSSTDTGELLTTDRTYEPALTTLTLTNDPLRATPLAFVKRDGEFEDIDVIVEDDGEGNGIGITRGENQGIYNPYSEEGWNSSVSPQGTLWSVGYQGDLRDITRRSYTNFYAAYGSGNLANVVPGSKAVMYVPSVGKYYLVEWASWTQGGNYGGFSYTRTEIDLTQVEEGIQFADGTTIKSAEGLGRVKSTAVGNRRIEEVTGYKEVSVTERNVTVLTTTASRSVENSNQIWIDSTLTTIDNVIENDIQYEVDYDSPREFSLDNSTWYVYNGGYSSTGNERGYFIDNTLTYNQGDTIYFRYTGGGFPQTWWSKNDLPGGGANFRGAVIDYHAFTGESTVIGTIHIVDDDGEDHISHQEVQSGSTDGENDDLWYVTTEGRIRYRRIDGEAKTLKVHWTAKVFYGSEYYDD